jgi:hypothetical protein
MHNRIYEETRAVKEMLVRGSHSFTALGRFIAELPELIGWYTGCHFKGLTLKLKGQRWLMVVRVVKSGKGMVSFIEADTIVQCYRVLYDQVMHNKMNLRVDTYVS